MTPQQKLVMAKLSPPSGKRGRLLAELKRKFKSPKECLRALGMDERILDDDRMAFDESGAPKFSISRCLAFLRSQGLSDADCDEFIQHMTGGGGGIDRARGTRDEMNTVSRQQHNAIELSAGGHGNMEADELPGYGRNHMPRPALQHAMDEAIPRSAAIRLAPGLANIRLGVLGWN